MDVECNSLDKTEKLEVVATSRFIGLTVEYHKKMAEAVIHALANWVPEENINDALSDIQYYSNRVLEELDVDVNSSRHGGHVG